MVAPSGFRNWLAFQAGEPRLRAFEFALYTDARVTSSVPNLGPYALINTIGMRAEMREGLASFALALRVGLHVQETPNLIGVEPRTRPGSYHGGWTHDEIASLLSLALGIRCRCGGMTRLFVSEDDAAGSPLEAEHHPPHLSPPPPGQRSILEGIAREVHLPDAEELLRSYPTVPRRAAIDLVRAARLYQSAVWLADADPTLAWLQLVGALETAAAGWSGVSRLTPPERLRLAWPELAAELHRGDAQTASAVATMLAPQVRSQARVLQFVEHHKPSPPPQRPSMGQLDWSRLTTHVRTVYDLRSRALHSGLPFPAPMCSPPLTAGDDTPWEAPGTVSQGDAVWTEESAPMHLHVFEYVVRGVLTRWWRTLATSNSDLQS